MNILNFLISDLLTLILHFLLYYKQNTANFQLLLKFIYFIGILQKNGRSPLPRTGDQIYPLGEKRN